MLAAPSDHLLQRINGFLSCHDLIPVEFQHFLQTSRCTTDGKIGDSNDSNVWADSGQDTGPKGFSPARLDWRFFFISWTSWDAEMSSHLFTSFHIFSHLFTFETHLVKQHIWNKYETTYFRWAFQRFPHLPFLMRLSENMQCYLQC